MSRRHVTYTTVPGATVRVMRAGGSVKETLYAASSGSTQVANPMTAGQDGTVSAYVEGADLVDLLVVAPAADPYSVTDVFVGSGGGGAVTLAALSDVDVSGAVDGDALSFEGSSGQWKPAAGGGGGSAAGTPIVRAFPFAFNTPGLLAGHAVYTPTVGDVLLDAWFEVTTAWDGTTPHADVVLGDDSAGLFKQWAGQPALDTADNGDPETTSNLIVSASSGPPSSLSLSLLQFCIAGPYPLVRGAVPAKFVTTADVKVVVSQDGYPAGDDPGSTHGTAVLYLVTATPA